MTPDIIIWAIAFVVLTVIEIGTFQFVSIWFAISALITMFCAIAGVAFMGQVIIFIIISAMLILATAPLMKKLRKKRRVATNSDLEIGKSALVIEEVNSVQATGRVRLSGIDWMALSTDNTVIPVGTSVIVEKVEGAKVYIKIN